MCFRYAYAVPAGFGPRFGVWMRRGWGVWPGFIGYAGEGGFAGVAARFGRGGRFFETGEVRLALLSLLAEGPKHGYQLMKDLEERSGGLYRASAGAIYPTLQQLEDEGLVKAVEENGKRVFRLTDAGKKELEANKDAVERIWQRAKGCREWAPWMGPEAASVAKPSALVMKSAMRAATRGGGEPERITKIRQILDKAIEDLDKL
jgi:DNA-binding PadR family transcriptional regulator